MGLYAKIVAEVIARMEYHRAGRQMLEGLAFQPIPITSIEGLKDFPVATLMLPTINEIYRPNLIGGGTLRIILTISAARAKGIPHLIEWVEKVLDALETKRDGSGQVDTNLDGTTHPFEAQVTNSFALDLSNNAQITIQVAPRPMDRGRRRTS